jgi:dihydrofolate reductase
MSVAPKIAAIVAMDSARVIGIKGQLPWNVPADMAHFRALTKGHVVLMGRKTWESLPDAFRPLPGRVNVVVSREAVKLELPEGVLRAGSPEEGIEVARLAASQGDKVVWVIGGAQLYQSLLPLCDEVHLTVISGSHHGDAWLPSFEDRFHLVSEKVADGCVFKVYAK